jgi:hypothetical protein
MPQHVNNRDLLSYYSAPFLSAIEAGARSIMYAPVSNNAAIL